MAEKKAFNFQTVKEPVFEYIDAENKTHAPKLWDLFQQLNSGIAAATRTAKLAAIKDAQDAGLDEPEQINAIDIARKVVAEIVGIPDINDQQALDFQAAIAEAVAELDSSKKLRQLSANS